MMKIVLVRRFKRSDAILSVQMLFCAFRCYSKRSDVMSFLLMCVNLVCVAYFFFIKPTQAAPMTRLTAATIIMLY